MLRSVGRNPCERGRRGHPDTDNPQSPRCNGGREVVDLTSSPSVKDSCS